MENLSVEPPDLETVHTVGQTALELFARPAEEFTDYLTVVDGRPLHSTPTTQRTFDPQGNRPDTVPDISQE